MAEKCMKIIFFSKSTFKSPHQTPKKPSTNTQQSLNDSPTKPYIKFPTNLQQSSFEGDSNIPVKKPKSPTNIPSKNLTQNQ